VGQKVSQKFLLISLPNIDQFSKFFTGTFCGKFVTKWLTPHLNGVATLPCEI